MPGPPGPGPEPDRTVIQDFSFSHAQPAPGPSAARLVEGVRLNDIYEVRGLIARGGMSEVYKGFNVLTEEDVAIKVILPHLAEDPAIEAMFLREARALLRFGHPSLVQYRLAAREPTLGILYLVIEYVDGPSLVAAFDRPAPSVEDLGALMCRLAEGLQTAHSLGVVHRDLSPDNILLPAGDLLQAKIIDFGIAKDLASAKTILGATFAGKLNFAAPEQLGDFDSEIGPWTDVYSLGLVMLSLAIGRRVDMGSSIVEAVDRRRSGIDLTDAPQRLQPIFEAMLRPAPKDRLRRMQDVRDRVEAVLRLPDDRQTAPPAALPPADLPEPMIAETSPPESAPAEASKPTEAAEATVESAPPGESALLEGPSAAAEIPPPVQAAAEIPAQIAPAKKAPAKKAAAPSRPAQARIQPDQPLLAKAAVRPAVAPAQSARQAKLAPKPAPLSEAPGRGGAGPAGQAPEKVATRQPPAVKPASPPPPAPASIARASRRPSRPAAPASKPPRPREPAKTASAEAVVPDHDRSRVTARPGKVGRASSTAHKASAGVRQAAVALSPQVAEAPLAAVRGDTIVGALARALASRLVQGVIVLVGVLLALIVWAARTPKPQLAPSPVPSPVVARPAPAAPQPIPSPPVAATVVPAASAAPASLPTRTSPQATAESRKTPSGHKRAHAAEAGAGLRRMRPLVA